jgi:3',5'-cyclic AMP phosphodiesterase CpdA
MEPLIDPRRGDVEDDASSTKRRSLLSLLGTLLAEISFPKLVLAWLLLLVLPSLVLGLSPLIASAWVTKVGGSIAAPFAGIWPVVVLVIALAVAWFAGGHMFRLVERSFWALNSLAVEPGYAACREALQHVADRLLPPRGGKARRARLHVAATAASGITICGLSLLVAMLAWPSTRWVGEVSDLIALHRLALIALANGVVLVAAYVAVAALLWALADATMAQPRPLVAFQPLSAQATTWRIAHLSDIHVVGERYGFRIESGRSGPQGNERLQRVLVELDSLHAEHPLDMVLITGDITDAGRSAEWAEFLDAIAVHPRLAERMLMLPGNHDLNVVDRANPARLDLPMSPARRLRQMRALSTMASTQGRRVRIVDHAEGCLGESLLEVVEKHRAEMEEFGDTGRLRLSKALGELWIETFPMVMPPDPEDGLGLILLNSNAETHFSFTNALGMISAEQVRGIEIAVAQYPRARWIIALHHHLAEYPWAAKELSERIGTSLVNGSWIVRRLQHLADRAVLMHGHRHIDWIGECAGLAIVSAPSPVMEATDDVPTYFYVHTLASAADGRLRLLTPQRITIEGEVRRRMG